MTVTLPLVLTCSRVLQLWDGSLHAENARQYVEKDKAGKRTHGVGGGRTEVYVEHDDGHDDGARDEHHGEYEVSAQCTHYIPWHASIT
jgi:hypothetical protein